MVDFLLYFIAIFSGYLIGDIYGWTKELGAKTKDVDDNVDKHEHTDNYSHLRRYSKVGFNREFSEEEVRLRYTHARKDVYDAEIIGSEIKIDN